LQIAILTISVYLPGCGSLKEKRQRIGGMHERFGRSPSVAVCESGGHDRHDTSEWSFVVTGLTRRDVESQCRQIEEKLLRTIDGRVHDIHCDFL